LHKNINDKKIKCINENYIKSTIHTKNNDIKVNSKKIKYA